MNSIISCQHVQIQLQLQQKMLSKDQVTIDNQQTIIIPVLPKQPQPQRKKNRVKQHPRKPKQNFEAEYPEPNQQIIKVGPREPSEEKNKDNERNSESKMKQVDQQTMGDVDPTGLAPPYEFLTQRVPSIRSIFLPRFTLKSITFFLSVIYIVMFIVLIGYSYSKTQTDLTWNCSLYQLQNKYFPKLRYSYQIWRVFVSALFHSNYAHFFLDLFALQLYGYFVEWYYGRIRYAITIVFAAVFAHFLSTVAQKTSISTTPSAALFAIIALKIFFLWQYRKYEKLLERRPFLYILLGLVVTINLIPIFVVNNIDYSSHLGGMIAGLLLGLSFLMSKSDEPTKTQKIMRVGSVIVLSIALLVLIALTFTNNDADYKLLSDNIDQKCNSN